MIFDGRRRSDVIARDCSLTPPHDGGSVVRIAALFLWMIDLRLLVVVQTCVLQLVGCPSNSSAPLDTFAGCTLCERALKNVSRIIKYTTASPTPTTLVPSCGNTTRTCHGPPCLPPSSMVLSSDAQHTCSSVLYRQFY